MLSARRFQPKYNSVIVAGEPSFKSDGTRLGGTPSPDTPAARFRSLS